MTKLLLRFTLALLLGCFLLPGCAYFSQSGRQQMAYQRYVKRCQKMKYRQRARITKQQRQIPATPEPKWEVTAGKIDSPSISTVSETPAGQ